MKVGIVGGYVVDPAAGIDGVADILVDGPTIARVSRRGVDPPPALGSGAHEINASGLLVFPAFIDLHAHLREPGHLEKETVASGSEAAAAGGFGTVCAMPNTMPVVDSPNVAATVVGLARAARKARVIPVGSLTAGRESERLADYRTLNDAGCLFFSDDGRDVGQAQVLRDALRGLKDIGSFAAIHAEDSSLFVGGVMHGGAVSARLGFSGIPASCESVAVARAVLLAEEVGARVHICHVSAAQSVDVIRWAKARGIRVTSEVTPHHLTLTDEAVAKVGALAKVNPPLRTEADRQALVAALADGTIDCVATDHAPHTAAEKGRPMLDAPFGIVGLETAFPLLYTRLVKTGALTLSRLVEALTAKPWNVLSGGQPAVWSAYDGGRVRFGTVAAGASADLCAFDLTADRRIRGSEFRSLCKATPFEGEQVFGCARLTIVKGGVVFEGESAGGRKREARK